MNDNQQFLLYTAPDGAVKVDVYFKDETVWLTAGTRRWASYPSVPWLML